MRSATSLLLFISNVAALVACGGATGGSAGTGGSAATGGATSMGGSAAMGGALTNSGGDTSSGGSSSDPCSQPRDPGTCRGAVPSVFHNPATHQCEPFVYGGCGGNLNRFASIAECEAACPGAIPSLDACDSAADCSLKSPGCCGSCEPVDASAFVAVNVNHLNDDRCMVSCGACAGLLPGQASTGRYFIPGCTDHRCQVVDVRETEAVRCTTDDDCVLHSGASCCQLCGALPVAFNKNANLVDLLCGGAPAPCLGCPNAIPSGYSALCDAGSCIVKEPPCTYSITLAPESSFGESPEPAEA